jgi:DNA-binding PadR family transcriptional regulator
MLVLGVVRQLGETHGYEVRRELHNRSAEQWANVQPGSIYHALRALTKDGLIETLGTEETPDGPARTRYRITSGGERELVAMVEGALIDGTSGPDSLGAATSMLPLLTRSRAVACLRRRQVAQEGALAEIRANSAMFPDLGLPAHVKELNNLWLVHAEAGLRWTREALDHLEAGEYEMAAE